jgi:signal transduction histidine kinase
LPAVDGLGRQASISIRIWVTNSGPVIPPDQIQRLFQPFQRLAPNRNGRRGGYGLGLAIVNAVAQAHRATITAHARPEGGLSISVQFALVPGPAGCEQLVPR